jgi:hypothetical protein
MNAEEPMTAEAIAADFGLPVVAIQEAISYCRSNPPEIAQDQAAEDALMDATGMSDPDYKLHPTPRLLPPEEINRLHRR